MPFRKQTDRILAGSLNLLPPGDLIPAGDSLQLENWRVDQAGALRSRRGMSLVGASSYQPFHRFFRAGADRYVYGGGNVLYGTNLATYLFGGANGSTCGFASMSGLAWFMNITQRRWMVGPTHHQWGIDIPITSGAALSTSGTATLSGNFTYYLSYANDYGHESNGAEIGSITVSSQGVQLSSLPVSADPQVTVKYIYRVGGGVLSAQRVGVLLNATTTFTDTMSVTEQQTTAIAMPTDHDIPPQCYGLVGPFLGRLIAYRSLSQVGRFWWSKTAQPWAWPGAADPNEGNWQDCGDVREAIYDASVHNSLMLFWKEKSIWRLDGDPNSNDPEQTHAGVGIVGPHARASAGGLHYIRGPEGVYLFNGDRETKISQKIDPIFKGEYTRVGSVSVPPCNPDFEANTVMAARFGRLYMSYPSVESATGHNDVTLVCDLNEGRWYHHRLKAGSFNNTGFTALYDEGTGGELLAGVQGPVSAIAYALEHGLDDASNLIPLRWQSRYSDQGHPDREKVYQDLVLDYSTADPGEPGAPAALTVKAAFDNGTIEALGTISATGRTRKTFSLGSYPGRMAWNAGVLVEGDAATTVRIHEATLHYYIEPRRARNWDSGVLDFGSRSVKQILAVEIDIECNDTCTLTVHNDYAYMSLAWSTTFAAAATRKTVVLQQEQSPYTLVSSQSKPLDARQFRFLLSVPEGKHLKLYGMRVKVIPLNAHFDGSVGEVYDPQPIGLGN